MKTNEIIILAIAGFIFLFFLIKPIWPQLKFKLVFAVLGLACMIVIWIVIRIYIEKTILPLPESPASEAKLPEKAEKEPELLVPKPSRHVHKPPSPPQPKFHNVMDTIITILKVDNFIVHPKEKRCAPIGFGCNKFIFFSDSETDSVWVSLANRGYVLVETWPYPEKISEESLKKNLGGVEIGSVDNIRDACVSFISPFPSKNVKVKVAWLKVEIKTKQVPI